MSIGHSNVQSSIGRTEMSIGHSNVHSSNGRAEMSIGLKYMSICPVDEQKCPFVQWTNRHCLMANALVYYLQAVRLSQITLLQLPWHCKRYMSIAVAPWVSCFWGGQVHHFSDKQIFCDITNSVVRKCSFD